MDAMNDLDRELQRALQVEPSGNFFARVRERISLEPGTDWQSRKFAMVTAASVVLSLVIWNVVSAPAVTSGTLILPHENLMLISPLPTPAIAIPPVWSNVATVPVLVSKSEMLALQRLFSGEIVAPPQMPVPDEVTIPEVAIDPIDVPGIGEGEQR